MSETYAQAKQMVATARRLKRKLHVRHNRRFEGLHAYQEIIKSGILGDVFEIKLRRNNYQRRDDWQTLMKYGGGQLLIWVPYYRPFASPA